MKDNRVYSFLLIFILGMIVFFLASQRVNSFAIDETLLQRLEQTYEEGQQELSKQLIQQILQDTKKQTWEKDLEAIQIKWYKENIMDDFTQELIIILSQGPKNSFIAIYQKKNQQYSYVTKIDDLYDIQKIGFTQLPEVQYKALYTEEYINQLLGAFEEGTHSRIYGWDGRKMKILFQRPIESKAYWNELWGNGELKEARWRLMTQEGKLTFESVNSIVVNGEEKEWISKQVNALQIPPLSDFIVQKQKKFSEKYLWNKEQFAYIKNTP